MTEHTALIPLPERGLVSPADVVTMATEQAKLLMNIVEQTGCYQDISGKKYLQVEAWETIGAFNRVHAVTRVITPIGEGGNIVGYMAEVVLVNSDGVEVGGATMPCFFTENACKGKEGDAKHKAAISAAQTFATSKAYRMNYSYVAILAGYQPTPAEEMTGTDPIGAVPSRKHGEIKPAREAAFNHWCSVHRVAFFKKGKMKGYAHPIKDTKDWCNEGDAKEKPAEASTDVADEEPEEAEEQPTAQTVDMDWLRASLQELQWADVVGYLKRTYNVQGAKVSEIIGKMNEMQKAEFVKEVESRLSMR